MNEPVFLKTVRIGAHSNIEEIISRKRHNGFWIDPDVVPVLRGCKTSSCVECVDLFCVGGHELTGNSWSTGTQIHESIKAAGYTLCTPEMGLLAYPLEPTIRFHAQEKIYVAMELIGLPDRKVAMRFAEDIPIDVDATNRRIFTYPPVTRLELTSYGLEGYLFGRWIFARRHKVNVD